VEVARVKKRCSDQKEADLLDEPLAQLRSRLKSGDMIF
jgi:hypothetical protein